MSSKERRRAWDGKLKDTSSQWWADEAESKKELGVNGGRGRKRSRKVSWTSTQQTFVELAELVGVSYGPSLCWH